MKQYKVTICTISKDRNHIISQLFATQKERTKRLLKPRRPDWDKIIKQTRKSTLIVK